MSEELLISTFCIVDDFCVSFESDWNSVLIESSQQQGIKKPSRRPQMSLSELMAIVIMFHQSGYRTFKHYYVQYVREFWQQYFPPTSFILPICLPDAKGCFSAILLFRNGSGSVHWYLIY